MMEEAMDESMDENEADMVDNPEAEMDHVTGDAGDAKNKDEDCKCGDNVNKALINSLAACSQTLSTIEECKVVVKYLPSQATNRWSRVRAKRP